ncbi:MAG: hypothetical protein ACI857_001017 [Arenicella sp.]|jgi:hypothetical protein
MDQIQQIIRSFSLEEHKDFRLFIQRKKMKGKRKDLMLYDFFYSQSTPSKEDILIELYDSESAKAKNAYHTIRKRLLKEINDFLYLKRADLDLTKGGEINKTLILIEHLLEHQLFKLAWKHLEKAELLASEAEFNQQLVWIFDLQIKNFNTEFAHKSLNEIVALRVSANDMFQEDESLKIIGSLVKQELDQIIKKGEDLDLQQITDDLIKQFDLENALFQRPKLLFNFVFLTRTVMLGRKEYSSFEGFLLNSYKKLERADYFANNSADNLRILYVVAHTLYRNKKFNQAIEFLETMNQELDSATKGIYKQFYPKYLLLYSACENFKGNLDFSIELLSQTVQIPYLEKDDFLNGSLNLAVYYFEKEDYKQANQTLINMGHTDMWLEKNMGKEWRLKKHIIEAIFQYELGHTDLAFDRVLSIERGFSILLKSDKYSKVAVFLNVIKQFMNNPAIAKTENFFEKIEGSFEWVGAEYEDLQEMSYYSWLKSKMQSRKFYDVLLELMSI